MKLTAEQVRQIREKYAVGARCGDVAAQYGITARYVSCLATGRDRRDAGGPITKHRRVIPIAERRERSQKRSPRPQNTGELAAAEIRLRWLKGETETELAAAFDKSQNAISDIIRHLSYCPHHPRRQR
jgi:hypothetical protein